MKKLNMDSYDIIDDILDYCKNNINGYIRLADVSQDPEWYHAKIDALQDLQVYILKKYT